MGHISFVGKLHLHALRAARRPSRPAFNARADAKHSLDFWLTSEDLPDPDNRVNAGP